VPAARQPLFARLCGARLLARRAGRAMWEKVAIATAVVILLLLCTLIVCRIWKRNRYYKKVQHSLDEEERAFQETLARSYHEDAQLDEPDQEKLQILETYLNSARAGDDDALKLASPEAPMPTRAEDVDRFMAELAAAAGGDATLPGAAEGSDGSGRV